MERASSGPAAAAAEAGLEREVRPDTVVPETQ